MIRTILAATIVSLDELRKWSKISFFVVTHAQSCLLGVLGSNHLDLVVATTS
jgi:hypothetical protein